MRVPNQAKRGALFSVKLLIKLRWKKEEWYQHNYFGTLVPTYLRNYVLVNFFDLYSGVNLNLNCGKGKIIKYSCFLIFTNRTDYGQISLEKSSEPTRTRESSMRILIPSKVLA